MAIQRVRNIAPFINVVFTVSSEWWKVRTNPVTGTIEIHRGLDIFTNPAQAVCSMLNGVVNAVGTNSTAGNYIIIVDNNPSSPTYGYATRYLHLASLPSYSVGDPITVGEQVGIEGDTGEATGVHLHVEMQDISRFNWSWHASYTKSDYLDPTVFMGIDNIRLTQWIYDGQPSPPVNKPRKKFPWFLYNEKLRKSRILTK